MACTDNQINAEIIANAIAYLVQFRIFAGSPVAVRPFKNLTSIYLAAIIAAAAHEKITSGMMVCLFSPTRILTAHIIRIKLPNIIQNGLRRRAEIPLCLSTGT